MKKFLTIFIIVSASICSTIGAMLFIQKRLDKPIYFRMNADYFYLPSNFQNITLTSDNMVTFKNNSDLEIDVRRNLVSEYEGIDQFMEKGHWTPQALRYKNKSRVEIDERIFFRGIYTRCDLPNCNNPRDNVLGFATQMENYYLIFLTDTNNEDVLIQVLKSLESV